MIDFKEISLKRLKKNSVSIEKSIEKEKAYGKNRLVVKKLSITNK